ncbi:MAG TPA: formate dehydrogenase accessory protein FdhE [Candidatus Tripitaka sp. YC43]
MNATDGITISPPSWDLKIERCKVLSERYTFAREILDFYLKLLTFQKGLYEEVSGNKEVFTIEEAGARCGVSLLKKGLQVLLPHSPSLLSIAREGPPLLATMAKEVSLWGQTAWESTLEDYQRSAHRAQPLFFFPRTLLQPYLQFALEGVEIPSTMGTHCPFCGHRPQAGCLRPMDNASQRFLICSFCHGEWPYQRLSCPNCAESDKTKLSYLVAEGWPAVRLDTCETCRQYIKTIDLGKDPEAVPVVDELATIPLDVWARERGYEKMELNLAGI